MRPRGATFDWLCFCAGFASRADDRPTRPAPPDQLYEPAGQDVSASMKIVPSPLVLAVLLSGCAAAMPGYSPPSAGVSMPPTGAPGAMEGDRYVMSDTEKSLDCKHLTGSMLITIARLKDKVSRAKPSEMSTSMKKSVAPVFGGSTYNMDPDGEIAREKAKLHAYNRHLGDKGCKKLDVDAELARPPEVVRY